MTLPAATRLGPYEIIAPIGEGGMGVVYRARDSRLRREVAIKILRGSSGDPDDGARLLREARTAASLNHSNICTVHDVGESGGTPYIAMELVDGETLQQAIRRGGLSAERTCRIGRQLADALEHAHGHGVIHRDFKSANVILTADGRVKVLDFGIAARALASTDATRTAAPESGAQTFAGTLGYMAPEVLQGAEANIRSDIWSLGVVLYEMVAGRRPFEHDSDSGLIASTLRDAPRPLPSGTAASLAMVIERCLAKDPSQRPAHASEVALALDVAMPRGAVESASTTPVRWRTALAIVAVVAIAGTVGWYFLQRAAPSVDPSIRFGNPTQITTGLGVEEFAAWSPDGRTIAYAADPNGSSTSTAWDIWIAQVGGGQPVNRTADFSGRDTAPSWSPDGSQIAFLSDRDGGGCYVMSSLGGPARRIAAAFSPSPNPPQWSADSSELGCVSGTVTAQRFSVYDVQTSALRRSIDLPGEPQKTFTTWTRDQRLLSLVASTAGVASDVSRLWVVSLSTGRQVALTDGRSRVTSPMWSPDGRVLYYVASSGATMDLWRQNIADDGTPVDQRESVTAGVGMRNAALSVDGTKIVYSQGRRVANVWRVPVRSDRVATWADALQVTFDQAFIECFDLDRRGERLVISSDRAGSFDLWMLPSQGGELQPLTSDPSAEWCPNWSPDGSTVAFYAYRSGNREVWTIPATGGEWRQITDNPGVDMLPRWAPDGQELVFLSNREGWSGAYAYSLITNIGRRLAAGPARWAPNDRRIAYNTVDGTTWVAGDDGRGNPVRLPGPSSGGMPSWTADGDALLVPSLNRRGILHVVADAKSEPKLVVDLAGRRGLIGDHGTPSDGRFIYFTWNDDVGDLWVMTADSVREK